MDTSMSCSASWSKIQGTCWHPWVGPKSCQVTEGYGRGSRTHRGVTCALSCSAPWPHLALSFSSEASESLSSGEGFFHGGDLVGTGPRRQFRGPGCSGPCLGLRL